MEKDDNNGETKNPVEAFIDEVIKPLDVSDEIVEAFARVDRAEFAPPELRSRAYTDEVITLGNLSSISQPSLVAGMLEDLDLKGDETVLEVGTATGFQASLLALLAKEVHTIEINPGLAEQARNNIKRLGFENITVHTGDGAIGVRGQVFDRIIITAAVKEIPPELIGQLAEDGILIAPVGESMEASSMTVFTKSSGGVVPKTNFACTFVPLVTETSAGWSETEIAALHREKIAMFRDQVREYLAEMALVHDITYKALMERIVAELGYVLEPTKPVNEEQAVDVINVVLGIFAKLQGEEEESDEEEATG